jgi:hypothetical protein
MADSVKRLVARLSVEGAPQAKSQLQDFARAGEESLSRVGGEGRRAAAALDSVGRSANDNAPRMTRFGETFDVAESKIKGTVRGINDVRGAIDLIAPGASSATAGIGALANTVGNLADVAGTLANVFLRNPIGLIAIGLSAAVGGYLALRDRIDETAKAETAYQKAIETTNPLLEAQIDATRRLNVEKARAAREATDAAITAQEAEIDRATAARERLTKSLERMQAAQARNPQGDFSEGIAQLESSIGDLNASIGEANVKISELRTRGDAASITSQDLAASLAAVRSELAGLLQTPKSALETIGAEFERTKRVLDDGLADGLRLTREEYDRLLAAAEKRRDAGLAELVAREKAANDELYASLQESIDRYNELANVRQRTGADIEAQIDGYYREADATRAGTVALQAYRQELERQKVEDDVRKRARDAFGDDAQAVEGDVARVLKAYDDLQLAKAQATGKTVDQADSLKSALDGVSTSLEGVGRRSAKTLADMAVGLDTANFSAARLIQTFASDILGKLIQDKITGPLAKIGGGFLDSAFGSLFGGGGIGNYFGGATPGSSSLSFGGPRAGGGPVEAGKAYLVGEHRAELFVPDSRGRIIPEVRSVSGGGASSGGGVVVNLHDNRSSRGSEPVRVGSSRAGNGDAVIDVWISDKIDAQLKSKLASGALDKPMGNAFGVTRKPIARG